MTPRAPADRRHRGAYYTPPWVARALIELGLEALLAERRAALHLPDSGAEGLHRFQAYLEQLRVLDPACGQGALLLPARDTLLRWRRWTAEQLALLDPCVPTYSAHKQLQQVLTENLCGVDLDPQAVARARDALGAGPGARLYPGDALDTPGQALDWEAVFPEVFDRDDPGFDCILANPPYVRLQVLRRAHPEAAEWLTRRYRSARAGHFDLYLPFVERGLELLRRSGILALIAPSAWLTARYGAGLRRLVREGRHLHAWVDLGDHQVFEGVTTYTALQVLRPTPSEAVRLARAPRGEADLPVPGWSSVPWSALPEDEPWVLLPEEELALWQRLRAECTPLEACCERISVGVQTSADAVYHLRRLGPGRYQSRQGEAVALEDALMRPLVSGASVQRYATPHTDTWLLFPYEVEGDRATLIPSTTLARDYPLAWAWLRAHERTLRDRDRGRADRDDRWWGYVYPKNLARQHRPKLLVPRLTRHLGCALDAEGRYWLDNVDVSGVLVDDPTRAAYLLGVLNGRVAHWAWVRAARPFHSGYRSANRQFLAPLPVPRATPAEEREVGRLALALQGGASVEVEARLDALLYRLYRLSEAEQGLVEAG